MKSKMKNKDSNEKLMYLLAIFGNGSFERAIWMIYLVYQGFTLAEIAIAQSLLNLAMFVGEVPTGIFGDRFGRKTSLAAGRVLSIIYLAGMIMANNMIYVCVIFILYGIGLSFLSGSDEALLYDSLKKAGKEKNASQIGGRYIACITVSTSIAIFMGGLIQKISWLMIFSASIVFQIIALGITLRLEEVSFETKQTKAKKKLWEYMKEVILFFRKNKAVRYMFMGASCIGAVNSIYYIYSQEQLNQIGLSILSISILYFATSLLCALLSMRVHIFEEKFTKKNMIITASAASAVCYLCMCFRMPFLTSFCFIILNILFNILETVFFGVINPELPSEQRASLLSTLSLVTAVIMTALSLGLGYLAKEIDLSILLGMLGLLLMMAGLVFIFQYFQFLKRQEKRSINS